MVSTLTCSSFGSLEDLPKAQPAASRTLSKAQLVIPEIPHQAVALKVDIHSGKIHIEEDSLLRTLTKLRTYVKAAADQNITLLQIELEHQVSAVKHDVEASIQEAIANVESEASKRDSEVTEFLDAHEEEIQSLKSTLQELSASVTKLQDSDYRGEDAAKDRYASGDPLSRARMHRASTDGNFDGISLPSTPIMRFSTQGRAAAMGHDEDDPDLQPQGAARSRSFFVAGKSKTMTSLRRSAEDHSEDQPGDEDENEEMPMGRAKSDGADLSPVKGGKALRHQSSKPGAPRLGDSKPDSEEELEKKAAKEAKEKEDVAIAIEAERQSRRNSAGPETLAALGIRLSAWQGEVDKNEAKFQELEEKLDRAVSTLKEQVVDVSVARSMDAEALRNYQTAEAVKHEEFMSENSAKLKLMDDHMEELNKELQDLEKVTATDDALRATQSEVVHLQDRVAQAALAAVIEPKLDGALVRLERLAKSSARMDEQLETTAAQYRDMGSEFRGRFSEFTDLDLAPRKEVEMRCGGLEQQMRGLSQLLTEVQVSLGDVSTGILTLQSAAADRTDLNVLREEMCHISESVKDREQAVLFGARCLSCNRVFDDVSKDNNAVDLVGEKQKNALFSQVQHALHSPKIDPLAKIKVLAVKVGRPIAEPGSSGAGFFQGRNGSSLACGVDDVQLVPLRVSQAKSEMHILPSSPRVAKGRRVKGAPQREVTMEKEEGPLDFKHPLAQLVDRSQSRQLFL